MDTNEILGRKLAGITERALHVVQVIERIERTSDDDQEDHDLSCPADPARVLLASALNAACDILELTGGLQKRFRLKTNLGAIPRPEGSKWRVQTNVEGAA